MLVWVLVLTPPSPSGSPALPDVGSVVAGTYRLVRALAAGGMGVVYEAEDARGARLALKVLRPDVLDIPEVIERFAREATLCKHVESPNIVRILDVGNTESGLPFIAMELLRGNDLGAEVQRRGPMPVDFAVRVVRQACAGVAAVHAKGVIHRDLKPSNIFLTRSEQGQLQEVKVLDFGVSKALNAAVHVTMTQMAVGTPLYMSPEQVRSAKHVDERTDVWALGVILFQLLAGKPPFQGESTTGVAAAIVADEPLQLLDLRPDLPRELAHIVATALNKDVNARIQSAEALASALSPFDSLSTVRDSSGRSAPLAPGSGAGIAPPTPARTDPGWAAQRSGLASRMPPANGGASRNTMLLGVGGGLVIAAAILLVARRLVAPAAPEPSSSIKPADGGRASPSEEIAASATAVAPVTSTAAPSASASASSWTSTVTARVIASAPSVPSASTTASSTSLATVSGQAYKPPKTCAENRKILKNGRLVCP